MLSYQTEFALKGFLITALMYMSSTDFQILCIFVELSSLPATLLLLQAIHLFVLLPLRFLSYYTLFFFVFFFCSTKLEFHPGNIPLYHQNWMVSNKTVTNHSISCSIRK